MKQRSKRRGNGDSLRIIGGRWRGRRIPAMAGDEVRPTPDRVRETLFNWLAPVVQGARCLDLFAGTGTLGIEALSRGAAEVWFVERNEAVARHLEITLTNLGSENDRVVIGDASRFLGGQPRAFDLVFLDPPFDSNNLENLCTLLNNGWLAPGARIYLEMSRKRELPELPAGWTVIREKTAGQVRYALAESY